MSITSVVIIWDTVTVRFLPRSLDLSTRAIMTAVIATVLAGAALMEVRATTAALVAVVLIFAWGWPRLVALPAVLGSSVVVAVSGVGAIAAVYKSMTEPWLRSVPLVLAMGIFLAFVNELARPDDRRRAVDSLMGTVTGVVLAVVSAGWLAADRSEHGSKVVVVTGIAIAVASVVAAIPVYGWSSFSLTVFAGLVGAVALGRFVVDVRTLATLAVGLVAGLVVASVHMLFVRLNTLRFASGSLAVVVIPIAVAGPAVYAIARLTDLA